ncbi:MAG: M56 family metallopeptidase [Deltaproteobacteria bacterium]|nr:M56 family metallopeptidase [Deltaproteobacteria bacterium]
MVNFFSLQTCVNAIFPLLVNVSFQVGVLVGLTLLCIHLLSIRSALIRHWLLLCVVLSPLLIVLLSPIVPSLNFRSFFFTPKPAEFAVEVTHSPHSTLLTLIPGILVLLWAIGTLTFLLRLAHAVFLRRRLRKSFIKIETGTVTKKLAFLTELMGIKADIELFASEQLPLPVSFGFLRPIIVLPKQYTTFSLSQLEMILIHELAHIKRHDYLVQLCQRILEAIFFFHPLFQFASRQLDRDREYICDAWVVQLIESPRLYADSLVRIFETEQMRPANLMNLLSASGSFRNIFKRIDRIMEGSNIRTKLSRKLAFSIVIGMCVFVSLASTVKPVPNDDEQSQTVLGEVTSEPEIIASQEVRGHKAEAKKSGEPGGPLSRTHWIGGIDITFGHPVSREEAVAMSELLRLRQSREEANLILLKLRQKKTEKKISMWRKYEELR